MPAKLHIQGILLFLFIPLVLFLFLKYPFGVPLSFLAAILLMMVHRLIARPFFLRNKTLRCFWCGKTGNRRVPMEVEAGERLTIELCDPICRQQAEKFFDFTYRFRTFLQIGIFLPLSWYVVTMLLNHYGIFHFPPDWSRFIFQFFVAVSVVTVSIAYRFGQETAHAVFPFPIHNLFLLSAKNTLLVFRYVGIWWLIISIYFLFTH